MLRDGVLLTGIISEAALGRQEVDVMGFCSVGSSEGGVSIVKPAAKSLHSVSDCPLTSHWTQAVPPGPFATLSSQFPHLEGDF